MSISNVINVLRSKIIDIPRKYLIAGAGALILFLAILVTVVLSTKTLKKSSRIDRSYTVAFIGTRFLAVNDLPRMMEAMSMGYWTQRSCLHTKGSLISILETGNGMASMWATKEAYNLSLGVYDFGACTVEQLFLGFDENIVQQDQNEYYYNDGRNPCFVNDDYYNYMTKQPPNQTLFDFTILSDHAKRMAMDTTREAAISELKTTYATYLTENTAIPVIVSPHAYWSQHTNMTGLTDVASFTSLIYEGSLQYAEALSSVLPSNQKVRIAPVSLAFLTVYEEDPELWSLLTDAYDIHASVFGSYLTGCVLFATVTGMMPHPDLGADVESLFVNSRALSGATDWGYPDVDQASYLWQVAKRVTHQNYKPSSLELN
jgi:hypothetical protein